MREDRRLFPATPLGARRARHWVAERLDALGPAGEPDRVADVLLVLAELAANAITHGHVPGRDFRVAVTSAEDRIRVEVTDARPERRPPVDGTLPCAPAWAEQGRGLAVVAALADGWGCDRGTADLTKTVWAEFKR
ncbi:ATP-binding protein [Streptomyces sp. MST-110588]|uniref:ATP-binding protein n=1 Tax=Streptomyces sp. MST-110588 TaxID=2833628 RepID=UPI001F5C548F|nr:ATP-binding protein [Streptomyces sp. MST-110588]